MTAISSTMLQDLVIKRTICWAIRFLFLIAPLTSGADERQTTEQMADGQANDLSQTKISTSPPLPPIKYHITVPQPIKTAFIEQNSAGQRKPVLEVKSQETVPEKPSPEQPTPPSLQTKPVPSVSKEPVVPPKEASASPKKVEPAPLPTPQIINVDHSDHALSPETASGMPPAIMVNEVIELYPRDTHMIILPEEARQIYLTDPKVAEIQQTNSTSLHVQALNTGRTEIVVTAKGTKNLYRYRVKVLPDFRELRDFIARNFNDHTIDIKPLPYGMLLEGTVSSSKIADDIKAIAERYFPDKGAVINRLQVKNSVQINLRVKIAEVNRTVMNQLGINWNTISNYGNFRFGVLNGRLPVDSATNMFSSPNIFTDPIKGIGARFTDGRNDIASLLDMLALENLASVLAEPNLITTSGEEASFLVGGEFPYPVAQGIGTTQTVSFQFKKYGISLSFLPVVAGNTITLRVRPEVSDLDETRTIRDQNGNQIPSIRTRRAESTMEMGNGQSMVMAGLLSDQTNSTIHAYPGLTDVPILGALFRSNDFKNDKSELVIVVTPYLVEPADTPNDIALPTDGLKYANFFDMVWRRRLTQPHVAGSGEALSTLSGETGFYY